VLPKDLLREVRKIEIRTRGLVDSMYAGGYRSVFKGRGIEFSGIREYSRGDEYRSIDWKVSARSGELHVREHIEERELQVMICLDLSGSMCFGSGSREKRETAVEFGAAMAMAAARNNDRVGICLFTDRVEKKVPPAKGRTHILRLIRDLLYFVPVEKHTDLRSAIEFVRHTLKQKSVVFLVSDFSKEEIPEKELKTLAARHDLIAVLMSDPREEEIPDVGLIELEDPETGCETIFDTGDRALVARLLNRAQKRRDHLLARLRRLGIDTLQLTAGKPVVPAICRLFSEREQRLAHP